MVLAALLLIFVFVVGPSIFILDLMPSAFGSYLAEIVTMSSNSGVFGGTEWLASFTIFYWAWWISWAPVRRYVYCQDFAGTHDSGVRCRGVADADRRWCHLVHGIRRHRHQPSRKRRRRRRHRR